MATWIRTIKLADSTLSKKLEIHLDRGEAEALALATELKADLVLLDERRARKVAAGLGLRYIGVIGVLVEAKSRGHVTKVKPALDALIHEAGFWVSSDLYARVLQSVGE
jgi:predicted nucleic acid-binding protein